MLSRILLEDVKSVSVTTLTTLSCLSLELRGRDISRGGLAA
jgi:hypothetical protein